MQEKSTIKDRFAFWRNKRVIVTGGAGFLGSYVVQKLQQRGVAEVGHVGLEGCREEETNWSETKVHESGPLEKQVSQGEVCGPFNASGSLGWGQLRAGRLRSPDPLFLCWFRLRQRTLGFHPEIGMMLN